MYQTDAETYEAAAELAAGHLAAAVKAGSAVVALPGGRGARAVQLALAGRSELAWGRITCVFTDERCVAADDAMSNLKVARDSLLVPRAVPADRVRPVPVDAPDPAAAYAATLDALGPVDVVLLDLADDGTVAALMPGSAALDATAAAVLVPATSVTSEPRVARVTIGPRVLASARHVVVTAVGSERAAAVVAALREPVDPRRRPAQLVLPSATTTWLVDRAAATELLRDARPAQ